MPRPILFFVIMSFLAGPVAVQAQQSASRPPSGSTKGAAVLPAEMLPVARSMPKRLGEIFEFDDVDDGTPLTEAEILRRISRIYDYQAAILRAQADEDHELTENLMALAMTEMGTLVHHPEIMDRPRFRELYRTVITEYERYYGVAADTLTLQYGDIFQFRADMFVALNDIDEPLLENVALPQHLAPVATVFPMTMNRLVRSSIDYLLRSPEKHLNHWMRRAETYFPMVEQVLAEEGVPDELKYLAMIESGLNPRARSWAQAAGMWQFISATGRAYGLDVNPWVDERLDPEKATRAAARHLRDLHKLFGGDWQLALAGYNCSPARIKRALRRAEERLGRKATFWDIYDDIPRETRNYVPMYIAAALVASNPAAFDVEPVEPGPRYAYHYVPVQGMLSLRDAARMAGVEEDHIRALNPELRNGTLPPSQEPYYLRLPLGTYDQFAESYATLPPEARRPVTDYAVRRGDSLGKIGARFGVSVNDLMRANGLRSTTIQIGQRLVVPVPDYTASAPPIKIADGKPVTVEYGSRSIRPIAVAGPDRLPQRTLSPAANRTPVVNASETRPAPAQSETAAAPKTEKAPEKTADTRIVYRVRRGDNLTEIARKYSVSIENVKRWNKLSSSKINAGQRLTIYRDGSEPAAATPQRITYRVRRGDTLSEIAGSHGVSVSDLRKWNKLSGSAIRSGQRLTIYPRAGAAAKTVLHRVQRGDNLTEIARKYGVSIDDLKRWNGLSSSKIRVGQRLKINT